MSEYRISYPVHGIRKTESEISRNNLLKRLKIFEICPKLYGCKIGGVGEDN